MTPLQSLVFPIFGVLIVTIMPFNVDPKLIPDVTASSVGNETTVDQRCMESCIFTDRRMECTDCIPINVTSAVNEIVLLEFRESRFVPRMFCGVSWPRVVNLTIVNTVKIRCYLRNFEIQNFTFDCLSGIETLKLGLSQLISFSHDALYGFDNVKTLDLTDCVCLAIPGLKPGLSLETNVPMLQAIILSNVGSALDGIQFSQDFVNVLAHKNISNLDISSSYIRFANTTINVDGICKCLRKLNLANSRLLFLDFGQPETCDSLREIDVSGITLTSTPILKGNITLPPGVYSFSDRDWDKAFRTISILYANSIISTDHYIHLNNVTFSLLTNNSITEIHLSGYNVPVCEMKLEIDPNHVTYYDLSKNNIERLSPYSLVYLEHLKIIDLSKNRLAVSKQSEVTFSYLFRNNSKLEIANLAHNRLTYLPSNVFALNTVLKRIDLSNNKVTQISFEIAHLHKLELLDLRENSVEYLNEWSRNQIDMLYKHKKYKQIKIDSQSFKLDLRNNIFSCECHSLDFLKWFVQSPVFEETKYLYYCEIDDKRIPMNTDAIKAAQYNCDMPKRKLRNLLLSVLLPCVSTGILAFWVIVSFRRYKRQKLLRRLREQIYLIHEQQIEHRFPVFLSYASEDSEFVEPNILQPLEVSICATFCVAFVSILNFNVFYFHPVCDSPSL